MTVLAHASGPVGAPSVPPPVPVPPPPPPTVAFVPVPVSATNCSFPAELSLIPSAPLRAPEVGGLNVVLIVHTAPAFKLVPHVLVSAKFPVTPMLVIFTAA